MDQASTKASTACAGCFEMLPYGVNSRYTRNNIVVVGGTSPPAINRQEDLPYTPANIPVLPSQGSANPCFTDESQCYNSYSGLQATGFVQNAVPQYWTPHYAAPAVVSNFQWEHQYQGNLEHHQNSQFINETGQMLYNNQSATGTGLTVHSIIPHGSQPYAFDNTEIVRSGQPFSFGTFERVLHGQSSAIGTGRMLYDGQPFAIAFGTAEVAQHNNRPFGIGQMESIRQCTCERGSGQVTVPNDNYTSLENSYRYIKPYSSVQPAYYTEPTKTTSAKAATNKPKYNEMSLAPPKKFNEDKNVVLTSHESPSRSDTPVRDENKSPVEFTRPFMKIKKKEFSPKKPLQKIKIENNKVVKGQLSALNKEKQVATKKPSTSDKFKKIKPHCAKMASVKKHSATPEDSSIKSDFEQQHKKKDSIPSKNVKELLEALEPEDEQKKTTKRSTLIEKLKIKLQKVDDEIRRRQIDLTIKNKLIKKELSSVKLKALTSNDTKSEIREYCHSIKKTDISKSGMTQTKTHSEQSSPSKIEVTSRENAAGTSTSRVKSVVKVVKRQKTFEVKKYQGDKENNRSHREKYYIIQKTDPSIYKTAQSDNISEGHTLNKSKIKFRNTVFHTKHDDLLIMLSNRDNEEQSQERKVKVQKRKNIVDSDCDGNLRNPEKIRKIDLTINVVPKKSEPKDGTRSECELFTDVSFLDDINADEIAEYLKSSENQSICESYVKHDSLGSNEAPMSLMYKTKDVECCTADCNSNDSMTIYMKKEKRDTNMSCIKIETGTSSSITAVNETPPSISPTICLANQADTVTLKYDLDKSSCSNSTKGYVQSLTRFTGNNRGSTTCTEINNNNGTSRENHRYGSDNSVMIVEDQYPNLIVAAGKTHEILPITGNRIAATSNEMARCKTNVEKSVVLIEEKHPNIITIYDDTEVITIVDDTENVITIADDTVVNKTNETQECTKIKYNENISDLLHNADNVKASNHSVKSANSILELLKLPEKNKEFSSHLTNKSNNNPCKSEDSDVKIDTEDVITIPDDDVVKVTPECTKIKDRENMIGPVLLLNADNVKASHCSKNPTNSIKRNKELGSRVTNTRNNNPCKNEGNDVKKYTEDVIIIADDDIVNITSENQDCTDVKDKESITGPELLHNADNDKAPNHSINPANSILQISKLPRRYNELDSHNQSNDNPCKSEDSDEKIGDGTANIQDITTKIVAPSTSFKEKDVKIESATPEASNNNSINMTDSRQCNKYPCKELHKVIKQQEASNKVLKPCVTKENAINKPILGKKKRKKLARKIAARELRTILEEEALAKKLEERVSDYMNLDLLVCSVIHRGTFSIIFNCIDREGVHVAAKMVKRECEDSSSLTLTQTGYKKETMLMKLQDKIPGEKLDLVYLINGLAVEENWCLLMDYYPKNLEQALRESGRGFNAVQVQTFAQQLVSAVATLTRYGIVHSDIKPEHILMDANNTTIKLCGFDESYYLPEARKVSNVGTLQYRAPEVILGHSAGHTIDVWAVAVVLYEMATGQQLFPGRSNNEVLYQHMTILGALPWTMVQSSAFKNAHYVGQKFRRRYVFTENNITKMSHEEILTFPKTGFARSLLQTYSRNWCKTKKEDELALLTRLYSILCQMLVLDPSKRISILSLNVNIQ